MWPPSEREEVVIYTVFAIAFGVVALLCALGARLRRTRRVSFIWALLSAAGAAIAATQHVFWVVATLALMTVWALVTTLNVLTVSWRVRAGLTIALVVGAGFAFYPTVHDEILCAEARGDAVSDSCPVKMNAMPAEQRAQLQLDGEAGNAGFKRWLLSNMGFRMVRGLDLKGGLRLVYTVDVDEAIRDKRDRYYDDLRQKLALSLGLAAGEVPTIEEMQKIGEHVEIHKPRDRVNTITVDFRDPARGKAVMKEAFLSSFNQEMAVIPGDGGTYTFTIRNHVETSIRETAVQQATQTIRRRIDGMGVKEASIVPRDEDIIIEIPGSDERAFEEIRDIISQTARLEFKILDDAANFFEKFTNDDNLPEGLRFEIENAPLGPGRSQPNFYARITALPHEDLEASLTRLKEWTATLPVDEDHEIGFEKVYEYDEEKDEHRAVGWRTFYLWSKAELTGDMVRDAMAQADQSDTGFGQWYVMMNLSPRGAELFETITEQNVKKRFAIILDGKVESAPEIREKIGGGTARITMGAGGQAQQYADSKKLELVLKSGALPAPISPTNEQRIGPTLGQDSIDDGVTAAAFGGLFVFLVIFAWYRQSGLVTNLAVFLNLMLQLTILSMFSASMTLPGIAGLALTIGMSVDANVLINERIGEELRAGKSGRAAVQLGYDKAFSSIFDGNATTMITGLILVQYGTGPIKGFAVALIVGLLCNLFTAVTVTRLIFDFWVRGRRQVSLGIR